MPTFAKLFYTAAKLAALGVVVSLILGPVLNTGIEAVVPIALGSLLYLTLYGVASILITGREADQNERRESSRALAAAREHGESSRALAAARARADVPSAAPVDIEDMNIDQLLAASNSLADDAQGPLFTDAEWALIFARPSTRHYATNEVERNKFVYAMRQDPEGLQAMKRAMADIRSDRDDSLSPMAKQWIWRIAIGLVVGLIVIALNQG